MGVAAACLGKGGQGPEPGIVGHGRGRKLAQHQLSGRSDGGACHLTGARRNGRDFMPPRERRAREDAREAVQCAPARNPNNRNGSARGTVSGTRPAPPLDLRTLLFEECL